MTYALTRTLAYYIGAAWLASLALAAAGGYAIAPRAASAGYYTAPPRPAQGGVDGILQCPAMNQRGIDEWYRTCRARERMNAIKPRESK